MASPCATAARSPSCTEATATWLGTGKRGAGLSPVELSEPAGLAVAGDQLEQVFSEAMSRVLGF